MDTQAPPPKSPLKNPYLYSGIILAGGLVYVAFLFLTRYETNREFERRNAKQAAQEQQSSDQVAIDQLGGTELVIRSFYATPTAIQRGGSAQLCYDVGNAKAVTLDPPAGDVWPSHNRCLDVSPKKTTTYTLTIADASGKSASQSVQLEVH